MTKDNPLKKVGRCGQSIWLDYIRRDLIANGDLRRFIEEDGLRGMTSNPSIFEKAITSSHDYDEDIQAMALAKKKIIEIYEAISQRDVQSAADEFRSLYDHMKGKDGYVSLEVNPHLARDTEATMSEARRLWTALNRPNVLIKVPATKEGLPVIQQLISEGININVTLLFGIPRYQQVIEAYLKGIEARVVQEKPVKMVSSVASFFISRIDVLVDPLLEKFIAKGGNDAELAKKLHGQIAIASAKLAYQIYKDTFTSPRFKALTAQGASTQRLLWASTSAKNPEYDTLKYVEALMGRETVDTIPLETLEFYRDHGNPKDRIEEELEKAGWILGQLPKLDINIDTVTQQLEEQGIEKFKTSFDKITQALEKSLEKRK